PRRCLSCTLAPATPRAVHLGQRPGASPVTPVSASTGAPEVFGRGSGTRRSRSNSTEISRATPRWPRQSGRLLVTSRSIARSPPTSAVDSWFRPVSASRSVSASTGMSSRTYWASQFQLTIIVSLQPNLTVAVDQLDSLLARQIPGLSHPVILRDAEPAPLDRRDRSGFSPGRVCRLGRGPGGRALRGRHESLPRA